MTPVRCAPAAIADIDAAVDRLAAEGGAALAGQFVDVLADAVRRLCEQPDIGARSFGHDIGRHDLRSMRLRPFPYFLLYIKDAAASDVVRVLQGDGGYPDPA